MPFIVTAEWYDAHLFHGEWNHRHVQAMGYSAPKRRAMIGRVITNAQKEAFERAYRWEAYERALNDPARRQERALRRQRRTLRRADRKRARLHRQWMAKGPQLHTDSRLEAYIQRALGGSAGTTPRLIRLDTAGAGSGQGQQQRLQMAGTA